MCIIICCFFRLEILVLGFGGLTECARSVRFRRFFCCVRGDSPLKLSDFLTGRVRCLDVALYIPIHDDISNGVSI